MKINLTEAGKSFVAGFNNSAKPLGERKEAELAQFLINAHQAGRQDYLDLFDNPPTLEALQKAQLDQKLAGSSIPKPPALAVHNGQLPADVPRMDVAPVDPAQVNAGEATDSSAGDVTTSDTTAGATTTTGSTGSITA